MLPAPTPHPNGPQATTDLAGYVPPTLPPGIVRALRVFKTHFPDLLAKHPRRWAACDGRGVLFVGKSQEILYKRCLSRGLKPDEFVVLCLLPDAAEYID